MTNEDTDQPALVPTTRFDAKGWRSRDALDYFHEEVRGLYDVHPTAATPKDWKVDFTTWQLEDLLFTKVRTDAHGVRRETEHLTKSPSEFVRLRISYDSTTLMRQKGEPLRLERGQLYLVDFNRDMDLIVPDGEQISVFMPHAAIGYDSGRHRPLVRIDPGSGAGLMLHRALTSMLRHLPEARQDEAPALANGFAGMLHGVLSGAMESQADDPVRVARLEAMRGYLDDNLRDPSIGLEALASAFGASRATIYRDFQSFGGVDRYIVRQRLRAAHDELMGSPPRRGVVASVAESWGFNSIHHFSRLFRSEFGLPPSEVVGARYVLAPDGDASAGGGSTLAYPQRRESIDTWLSSI